MRSPRLPGPAELRSRRRFWRARDGATAVEFALLAPFFFLVLFFMVQVGTTLVARQVLDLAVTRVARQVQLAPSTRVAMPLASIRRAICSNLLNILNCNRLDVRLTPWSDAGVYCPSTPCVARQLDPYVAGYFGDIMRLEVTYDWPLLLPVGLFLGSSLPTSVSFQQLRLFRKEPPQ